MKFKIPQETKSARVIQVIETVFLAGDGTDTNPVYEVHQYWTLDGDLLAKNDPFSQDDVHPASSRQ
jgi:hypothetical protein